MSDYTEGFYTLAAKIQSAKGTPATPTVSADAIRCGPWSLGPIAEQVPTNESNAELDDSAPVFSRKRGVGSGPVKLKHSGTAETPPDVGVLLRMSGMSENIFAAAVAGTAQAGSTTSITLASGASSTDDFYAGCWFEIDGGAQDGYTGMITAYNGTTKVAQITPTAGGAIDNTSTYDIPKQVVYRPRNAGSTFEWGTVRKWDHRTDGGNSILRQVNDAVSTWRLSFDAGGLPELAFDILGSAVALSDVAYPGRATTDLTEPVSYRDARTYLASAAIKPSRIEIDWGSRNELSDDPNDESGYGAAEIMGRQCGVSIQLPKDLVANRNSFALIEAATQLAFAVWWPVSGAAGTRFGLVVPKVILNDAPPAQTRGFSQETLRGGCVADGKRVFLTFF